MLCPGLASGAPPQRPFPQHVSYAAGSLRPSHRSQSQQDDDVRLLYEAWKLHFLSAAGSEPDGHPRYRVRWDTPPEAATVSEGQGYGMVISVLMAGHDAAARTIFDGLLEFAKDHPSEIDARLMDWWVEADEIPERRGNDSAFDGDADIAYALLMAEQQWGAGGRFDYGAEASALLAGMLSSELGPQSRLPLLGDWVQPDGSTYSQLTPRTSDFLPDHFLAFAQARDAGAWLDARAAASWTIDFIQQSYAPSTGLVPDFLEPVSATDPTPRPASPNFLEGANDGFYYYNSARVPLRLGVSALVGDDAVSREQVQRLSLWIEAEAEADPARIRAGYRLDGTPVAGSNYFTSAFAAPLGVAAMSSATQQQWLNDLYEAVRLSQEGYYEDTLTLLSMLVMTGNYWSPAVPETSAVPVRVGPGLAALMALLGFLALRRAWRAAPGFSAR